MNDIQNIKHAERIAELLFKFYQEKIGTSEWEELNIWVLQSPGNADLLNWSNESFQQSIGIYYSIDVEKGWSKIQSVLGEQIGKKKVWNVYRWIAAAVLFVIVGCFVLFYMTTKIGVKNAKDKEENITTRPIKSYEPSLKLANGPVINLDSVLNGDTLRQSQVGVIKKEGWGLVYDEGKSDKNVSSEDFNVLTIPRRRQYKIQLPDGTKVWLNSASTLRYPTAFNSKSREVFLEGEAYFEVKKVGGDNDYVPFIVHVDDLTINVTGTRFNVNAYQNEPAIRTSLLEGAVYVAKGNEKKIIHPWQEVVSIKENNTLDIQQIDRHDDPSSWTKGELDFFGSAPALLRAIERAYDVKVSYGTGVVFKEKEKFHMTLSPDLSIDTIIKVLNETISNRPGWNIYFNRSNEEIVVTGKKDE